MALISSPAGVVVCFTVLCSSVLCNTVVSHVQYCGVQYSGFQYYVMQYCSITCAVLCSAVLWCRGKVKQYLILNFIYTNFVNYKISEPPRFKTQKISHKQGKIFL